MLVRACRSPLLICLLVIGGLARPCSAHVALVAPNGGEVLLVGSTFTIQWQIVVPHTTLNWDLEYSISGPAGPWLAIAIDLPVGMTSYAWTVPNTPSTQVRVRVTQDNTGTDYSDISDANLAIVPAAAFTPFGSGCAGSAAVPTLAPFAGELPQLGATSHLRADQLASGAAMVLFAVGFSDVQARGPGGVVALPFGLAAFGLPACTQYVSVDLTSVTVATSGHADWPLTLPNQAALAGNSVFVQAVVFEPLGSVAVANAVAVAVGY